MDVTITISAEEFVEFLEFRKDHKRYERENLSLLAKIDVLVRRISDAIEPDDSSPGKYIICDHGAADDLWILAGNCDKDI